MVPSGVDVAATKKQLQRKCHLLETSSCCMEVVVTKVYLQPSSRYSEVSAEKNLIYREQLLQRRRFCNYYRSYNSCLVLQRGAACLTAVKGSLLATEQLLT